MRGLSRAGLSRWLRRLWDRVDDLLPHGRRTMSYKGFKVVYSRRTSLVERIRQYGDYEPEITRAIAAELGSATKTLVDVGANIGLISLGVLAEVPGARIFAFEPGRHQHDLFRGTIRRNGLERAITLSPLALSDRPGRAEFAVHSTRHSSGDGFVDTGRAGPSRIVSVETDTLDRWWERSGRPSIDVIKIDTEGSELLVLRGASEVLTHCRPVLFLEIHPPNVRGYTYSTDDVRWHVEGQGYRLEAVSGESEFVARPV